jgi:hypothetical protein
LIAAPHKQWRALPDALIVKNGADATAMFWLACLFSLG